MRYDIIYALAGFAIMMIGQFVVTPLWAASLVCFIGGLIFGGFWVRIVTRRRRARRKGMADDPHQVRW